MTECDVCKEYAKEITCDHCRKPRYCSLDCKILGTRSHKTCPPPTDLRSVDHLYIDVYNDVLPTNEKTIKDYGFNNCKNAEEWCNLGGLYCGLLKFIRIPRDVLHDHCMKDEITDLIKKTYENMPVNSRGECYPWFLQHQNVVRNGNKMPETARKSKNKAKPSAKYSIQDGAHVINYGYNGEKSYYYLNVEDPRLAWRAGLTQDVEKVTNDIDSTGKGIVLQLQTFSSSSLSTREHQVSVETLAVFYKRYGVRNSHIEKMKQGKSF